MNGEILAKLSGKERWSRYSARNIKCAGKDNGKNLRRSNVTWEM